MKKALNIFGIEVTVESDDEKFLKTAEEDLWFFRDQSDKNIPLAGGQRLHVVYSRDQKVGFERLTRGYGKIGNNAFINSDKYVFIEMGLVIEISGKDGNLSVKATPLFRKGIRGAVKKVLLSKRSDYFLLVRHLIVFPVFHLLERKPGLFLLHGSAVDYNGTGIVIAGPAGVGKTSAVISMTLNTDKRARFLTDNFLLFDSEYIYPFPGYIRLSDNMVDIIENISMLGAPSVRRFNRNHYILDNDYIAGRTRPGILFIPALSEEEEVIPISADVALDRLLLANDNAKEFHMYSNMGLMAYMDRYTRSVYRERMRVLEQFLSKIRIYELHIKKTRPLARYWEEIIKRVS